MEGDGVFNAGSRATVAITVLVKNETRNHGLAALTYKDIGDYHLWSRGEAQGSAGVRRPRWIDIPKVLVPNEHGDWIGQRTASFQVFDPIVETGASTAGIFSVVSIGVNSGHDSWVYNSDQRRLVASMTLAHRTYEEVRVAAQEGRPIDPTSDPRRISWTAKLLSKAAAATNAEIEPSRIRTSSYRPFFRQWAYLGAIWNDRQGKLGQLFPTLSMRTGASSSRAWPRTTTFAP